MCGRASACAGLRTGGFRPFALDCWMRVLRVHSIIARVAGYVALLHQGVEARTRYPVPCSHTSVIS